jgi:transcriptional repressor NrdR
MYSNSSETKVIDSRPNQDGQVTRRRRFCEKCGYRFTTYERVEEIVPLVVKKDARRESFSRDKIVLGITKACQKRPIDSATIESIVSETIKNVQSFGEKEIPSKKIGYIVMNKLRNLDEVAFIRFASFYREFHDIDSFILELQEHKDFPVEDPATTSFPFDKKKKFQRFSTPKRPN